MKKFLPLCFFLFGINAGSFAQVMQASIGPGSASTNIKIYIRPNSATSGIISTLQFSVAISDAINPVPTLTIVGTPAIGSGWQIDAPYDEGGMLHYDITCPSSPNVSIGANIETEVMELKFSGGPSSAANVALFTLPEGGGTTGNALFFCSGAANSAEGQLYYPRSGVIVVNNNSYTGPDPSSATMGNVNLPVKWLSFDVVKLNSDALLNWKVTNEENCKNYEVQRSLNGHDFSTLAAINSTGTPTSTQDYSYTDHSITILGVPVIYYRLKQVDNDGRFSYSEIRKISLNLNTDRVTVFPNPVVNGFYVAIPTIQQSLQRNIRLILVNSVGQTVQTRQISSLQASNYYFDIRGANLASGNYFLQVFHDGELLERKQLFISRE